MKGLLIKDFKMIKTYGISFLIISVVYFLISMNSNAGILYNGIMILSVAPIAIFGYDEQFKWSQYEATLPISKTKIVLEKYLFLLIMITPIIIIENLLLYFMKNASLTEFLYSVSIMTLYATIMPIILLPIIFRVGYLKSKIFNIILIAIITIVLSIIATLNGLTITNINIKLDSSLILIATIILFIASFGLSVALYKRREF